MGDSREIAVRIAVCVDPNGKWSAAGWGDKQRPYDKEAMDTAVDGVEDGEARYWVEAILTLPSVPTMHAESVEPAE